MLLVQINPKTKKELMEIKLTKKHFNIGKKLKIFLSIYIYY